MKSPSCGSISKTNHNIYRWSQAPVYLAAGCVVFLDIRVNKKDTKHCSCQHMSDVMIYLYVIDFKFCDKSTSIDKPLICLLDLSKLIQNRLVIHVMYCKY